ncbi:MAG TPA: hypothetical protein VM142_11510 [Acidimicrobiales bacterium]|nr:hypothetical protein [Acidimicrobiales bacterium]
MRIDVAWAGTASVVTSGWMAATIAAWDLPFDTTSRGTAAAAATAALVGAAWRPRTRRTVFVPVLLLLLLPPALAQAAGGSSALLVAMVLCHAAVETIRTPQESSAPPWCRLLPVLGLVAAAAFLIAGIVADGGEGWSRPLPSDEPVAAFLGAVAATLLVLVASVGSSWTRPLVVPGLLVGLVAVPGLPQLAVVATAAAAAAFWATRVPAHPAPALAALALAAAVIPDGGEASGLLAGAAALCLAVPHPAVALLGVPGAAALAAALVVSDVDGSIVVVVLGAVVTAMALSRRMAVAAPFPRDGSALQLLPAGALAMWVVLRPGSWGWTGAGGGGTYDRGASLAMAAALLVVVANRIRALPVGGHPE